MTSTSKSGMVVMDGRAEKASLDEQPVSWPKIGKPLCEIAFWVAAGIGVVWFVLTITRL